MFLKIIGVGLILRILFIINNHDFWYDESYTYFASNLKPQDILKLSQSDNNPPLYYLLIHFLIKISDNEHFLRLPSLLAGLATIPLAYKFSRLLTKSQKVSNIAALLVAISPLTLYLSTEARPHSLAIFLLVLLLFLFVKIQQKPKAGSLIAFTLISILALYTHYYIALLFVPLTLIVVKNHRIRFSLWVKLVFIIFLSFTPWLLMSLKIANNICWCPRTIISVPSSLVSPALGGIGLVTLRFFPNLPWPLFYFFTLLGIITAVFFTKGLFRNFSLAIIYFVPLLILSILGFFLSIFSPKAFAITAPVYLTIVALGTKKMPYYWTWLLVLSITAVSITQNLHPFFKGDRVKAINRLVQTENYPVLHVSIFTYYPVRYYTRERNQLNVLTTTNPLNQNTTDLIGGQKQTPNTNIEKLWLVDMPKYANQKDRQETLSELMKSYYVYETYQFTDISVSLLVRDGSGQIQ